MKSAAPSLIFGLLSLQFFLFEEKNQMIDQKSVKVKIILLETMSSCQLTLITLIRDLQEIFLDLSACVRLNVIRSQEIFKGPPEKS